MAIKNVIKKSIWQFKIMEYLAYLMVFLVPLYFNIYGNKLFIFSAPKMILMILISLLMVILYSWVGLNSKNFSFKITPIHIVLIIFLLVLTISSILGIDPLNSFFGRFRDGINLILLYSLTLFALFIGFLIKKNKEFLLRILSSSFISSIIVALISYDGSFLGKSFIEGNSTIGNNSYTGTYLLFNVIFGLGLFLYYKKIWQKIGIAIGSFVIFLSPIFFNKDILMGKIGLSQIIQKPFILLGFANAAILGLVVSFLVIILFYLLFSSKKLNKIIGFLLLCSLMFSIFYTGRVLINPSSSLHKIYVEQKGENRFNAWNIAQLSFVEKPFIGSGFNNYYFNYQKYFSKDIVEEKNPEFYFNQPHNIVWEYASNNGILGLVSFFALLIFIFLALFSHTNDEDNKIKLIRISLIGALFGYFIQNLFGFDTPTSYLMFFMLIGLAIGLSKTEKVFTIEGKNIILVKIFYFFSIIFSLISIILFVFLPYLETKEWRKIGSSHEKIISAGELQKKSFFGGISDSNYFITKFIDLYKNNIDKINNSNKDLILDEIQANIDLLEKENKIQPLEINSYVNINQLLNLKISINKKRDEKSWSQSYDNIMKAISLNSQNPEFYILLAQTHLVKGDYRNAFLSVRQAIIIAPKYKKSYDYARKILLIKPDTSFQKYVDDMENRWLK